MMTEEEVQPPLEPTASTSLGLEPTQPVPKPSTEDLGTQVKQSSVSPRQGQNTQGWSCCSLPHGAYSLLPSFTTTAAFCLSLAAHFSCQFIQRDIVLLTASEPPLKLYDAASIGLWSFLSPENDICFGYPSGLSFDSFFKTCRAMAPMAVIIGGLCMIVFWSTSCVGIPICLWQTCGILLLITTLFEGLTFLIFRSNFCGSIFFASYDCALATGGRCGVAACVLWFVSALTVWKIPHARNIEAISSRQSIITTETILPDGTKKIETKKLFEPDI